MKCCDNIRKGDMTDTACSTGAERQSSLQLLKLTGHGKQVKTILSCLVLVLLADAGAEPMTTEVSQLSCS